MAYVLAGARIGHYGTDAIATIPVQRGGWTDLGQVRSRAQAWLTERRRNPTLKG